MSFSICLLVASCVAADRPAPSATVQPVGMTTSAEATGCGCDSGCDTGCCGESAGDYHTLGERLKGLFSRLRQHGGHGTKGCESACGVCGGEPACCSQTSSPPLQGLPVAAVEPPVIVTSAKMPLSEIKPQYLTKVANAADYTWVTGQLYHVATDGGLWVVRYAPIDREDRYGGSVVLAAAVNMEGFREGDLVTIHGEVLSEGRASKHLGGPPYRTVSAELVERAPEEGDK